MSLRETLREMVEHTPEGVEVVPIKIAWLRRQLDEEATENPAEGNDGGNVYLSTSQASERLSVTAETIARWCRNGRFPNAFKTSSDEQGEWRIPLEEVSQLAGSGSRNDERVHFDRNEGAA